MDIAQCSDKKLLSLCALYGEQALRWKRKFAGLLPEVNRRKLYEKKRCGSIFEFAKKYAGMSEEQVRRVLNLEVRFDPLPVLKEALVRGEINVSKLARVASIATPENQEILVEQAKILSKNALETLVRDESKNKDEVKIQSGLFEPQIKDKSVPGHRPGIDISALKIPEDVLQKLLELQNKDIDLGELLRGFLQKREEEIEEEKEHGEKCSMQTCSKPAEHIHHTQRFALAKTNDPHYLAPLCREHHQIAHMIDLGFYKKRAQALH